MVLLFQSSGLVRLIYATEPVTLGKPDLEIDMDAGAKLFQG